MSWHRLPKQSSFTCISLRIYYLSLCISDLSLGISPFIAELKKFSSYIFFPCDFIEDLLSCTNISVTEVVKFTSVASRRVLSLASIMMVQLFHLMLLGKLLPQLCLSAYLSQILMKSDLSYDILLKTVFRRSSLKHLGHFLCLVLETLMTWRF